MVSFTIRAIFTMIRDRRIENNSAFLNKKYTGSEPTAKMLRISSVWRIRQIKFQKQS